MGLIENIAKNIEIKRKQNNLSIDRLSKKANLSVSVINKILGQKAKSILVDTLYSIAKALNCKMDDLVK